jgi:16S rRNA (guanine527-N7)-methyltransferase
MYPDRKKHQGIPGRLPSGRALPETRDTLERMLRDAGIALNRAQLDLLWRFHSFVRAHNEACDLTRLRSFPDFVVKHYIDCLVVPSLVRLPSPLLDIGTGAGFPGIPLKIAVPDCVIILAEGRSKKAEFLRMALKELGLEGISVFGRGILPGRLDRSVGGVITRALESASETLLRVTDILEPGGSVILMKGPHGSMEIPEALGRCEGAFRLRSDIPYTLAGTSNRRRLIVFEKISPPQRVGATHRVAPTSCSGEVAITSAVNQSFKEWKTLRSGRGLKKTGLALVAGRKIISEAALLRPGMVRAWIGAPRLEPPPASIPDGIPRYTLSAELFRELDVHGTGYPLLLVSIPEFRPLETSALREGIVLLLPFQDPANVGAAIRSAAAFGVHSVVLLREAANPFHSKSIRSGGASVFLTDFYEGPSIRELEGALPIPIVALSPEGTDISEYTFPERFALLPGVEGPGLPEGLRPDDRVKIPMEQHVESLNAAAAVAIALFELQRRKRLGK